jgi:hypothetical protein
MFRVGTSEDMIAAGFEQNFSNGERPFVVVNAKDGALGFHKPHEVTSYIFFTPEQLACPDSTTIEGAAQVLRRSIPQKIFSPQEKTKQHHGR